MSRPKPNPRAGLRVEWWSPIADWVGIGPWFETREEAQAFEASLTPMGRTTRVRHARAGQLELEDRSPLQEFLDKVAQ